MDKGSYKNIPVGYVADFMGNIFQLIDQTKWRLRKVSLTYFFFNWNRIFIESYKRIQIQYHW